MIMRLLLTSLTVAACTLSAQAAATRTWVSGTGDDANPCSFTAPCKTFAGAISKTSAGGEIDAEGPGGYGAVTITKSITIDGGAGQVASILNSGSNGIVVSGAGVVVTIRNLAINGAGAGLAGISFTNGAQLNVVNCEIQGNGQYGISFLPQATGAKLFVTDTTIHDNAGYGVILSPTVLSGTPVAATLNNVKIFHNGVGMRVADNVNVMVTRGTIATNTADGIVAATTTAVTIVSLEETTVSNNGGNGITLTLTTGHPSLRISNTYVSGNGGSSFVIPFGSDVTSFGNNRILDNGTNTAPNIPHAQQ